MGWEGLWCLTLLSTIFQLYRGGHFVGGNRKPECPEKTTDMSRVIDKLYIYREHLVMSGIPPRNFSGDRH